MIKAYKKTFRKIALLIERSLGQLYCIFGVSPSSIVRVVVGAIVSSHNHVISSGLQRRVVLNEPTPFFP